MSSIFIFTVATQRRGSLTYQGRKEQDSSNKGSVNGIREYYTDASQQNEKAYIEVFFSFFIQNWPKSIQQIRKAGLNDLWEVISLRAIEIIMESLILAQNERWRRVLSMQVEREYLAC